MDTGLYKLELSKPFQPRWLFLLLIAISAFVAGITISYMFYVLDLMFESGELLGNESIAEFKQRAQVDFWMSVVLDFIVVGGWFGCSLFDYCSLQHDCLTVRSFYNGTFYKQINIRQIETIEYCSARTVFFRQQGIVISYRNKKTKLRRTTLFLDNNDECVNYILRLNPTVKTGYC